MRLRSTRVLLEIETMKHISKIIFVGIFCALPTAAFAAENSDASGGGPLPQWILTIAIGIAVSVGLIINNTRQRKKNQKLWLMIEPVLRRGPATLAEIAEAIQMGTFYAKGKVALCLQQMTGEGRVVVTPAPEGTPQLQKVNHIKYVLHT